MDSRIDWCDKVWDVTRGCTPASDGCVNCWAARYGHRFSGPGLRYEGLVENGKWTGEIELLPEKLSVPLHWRKPQRIFVNSKSDLFHEKVPNDFIAAVYGVMASCPQHTFMILTKRPDRMAEWYDWVSPNEIQIILDHADDWIEKSGQPVFSKERIALEYANGWPLRNVWALASCENQKAVDTRVPDLLRVPAVVHGVSMEPMLEDIRLKRNWLHGGGAMPQDGGRATLSWIVLGCESGPKARPFKEEWARSIKGQCVEAGVAFYYKQRPKKTTRGIIHKPRLDGRSWTQFPEVSSD